MVSKSREICVENIFESIYEIASKDIFSANLFTHAYHWYIKMFRSQILPSSRIFTTPQLMNWAAMNKNLLLIILGELDFKVQTTTQISFFFWDLRIYCFGVLYLVQWCDIWWCICRMFAISETWYNRVSFQRRNLANLHDSLGWSCSNKGRFCTTSNRSTSKI